LEGTKESKNKGGGGGEVSAKRHKPRIKKGGWGEGSEKKGKKREKPLVKLVEKKDAQGGRKGMTLSVLEETEKKKKNPQGKRGLFRKKSLDFPEWGGQLSQLRNLKGGKKMGTPIAGKKKW